MPFTFAHPAAVIPLKQWKGKHFSTTGLLAGSIIPDFESFIRLGGLKSFSHTLSGMFWFDLPMAILAAFLFHGLIRNVLIEQLPVLGYLRLEGYTRFNWPRYFAAHRIQVMFSILIGVVTHLIWDRITHTVIYWQDLQDHLEIHYDQKVWMQVWLQRISSVLGIAYIFFVFLRLNIHSAPPPRRIRWYWPVVTATIGLLVLVRSRFPFKGDDLLNTALAGLFLGILIAALPAAGKYRR